MWRSKTKTDLIIEVWEELDCESVGAEEIKAIETAVKARFGRSSLDSPMVIARMLADEGAELRHPEIMALYVDRRKTTAHEAALRDILDLSSLRQALLTIRDLENLRRKYAGDDDREGLRRLRETTLNGKLELKKAIDSPATDDVTRAVNIEISQWLSVWLQTPQLFGGWVELRQRSEDFRTRFGRTSDK